MTGKKMSLVFVSAVFLLGFCAATSAVAAPGGHGGFGDPVFGLVQRLDLTEAQQKVVADYLSTSGYTTSLQTDLTTRSQARVKLITDTLTVGTPSSTLDTDATDVANAEEAIIKLRATTVNAILSKLTLTTYQHSVITKFLSKVGKNSTARIDARIDRLNEWISRHK
jgi:hypothetical protein